MPPLTRPQLSTRLRSLIHFVDDFIGASEQNCSLRQKKQTGILDFAHQGEPISVTEIPESESPFVATKRSAGRSFAEIKRAVASAQGRLSCGERLVGVGVQCCRTLDDDMAPTAPIANSSADCH
jgi:hypothetical protein